MTSDKTTYKCTTSSPEETMGLGERFGRSLSGGEVIALTGSLGTGKTHFIKGAAEGLGAGDAEKFNSPTFVLVNEYPDSARGIDIYHIDAYRIETEEEFELLAFDDMCTAHSAVFVEWADKVANVLKSLDPIIIELSHVSENEREIIIKNISNNTLNMLKG